MGGTAGSASARAASSDDTPFASAVEATREDPLTIHAAVGSPNVCASPLDPAGRPPTSSRTCHTFSPSHTPSLPLTKAAASALGKRRRLQVGGTVAADGQAAHCHVDGRDAWNSRERQLHLLVGKASLGRVAGGGGVELYGGNPVINHHGVHLKRRRRREARMHGASEPGRRPFNEFSRGERRDLVLRQPAQFRDLRRLVDAREDEARR